MEVTSRITRKDATYSKFEIAKLCDRKNNLETPPPLPPAGV